MSQEPENVGDQEYFEDENLAFLPADHPLMSRLQVALKKTLEQDHERVHLQVKEKETNLKKLEREREDTAVQLYEVQQNLAELHLNLEQTHQNYNLIQKIRVEAEQKLSVLNQEHQVKKVEIDQLMKNTIKAQDELSKLARTVKQIEDYNVQMKSEIAVMRRGTYRAEENITNQEKVKKGQDLLIDHLNEQKKKLNEQIVILEAQVLAQKDETKAAKDILKEAFVEMENINASKKNLLERWQKSLLEMQRRDKALQVARDALKVQYELNVQVVAELGGVNNEIKREGAMAETLAENLNRLTLEERRLDEEKQRLEHDTSKLNAQIKILQQSLQSTETNSAVVERENKKVLDQMNIIEENIMKIHTQSRNLYEHVIHRINEHKTLEKKSANLLKQAQEIGQKMQEKDIEKETYENEIARVDIDMLNTKNQIEVLKAKKRDVSEERKKKEETVATYELEIRQGHDINEKKQSEVGKLNKLHDEIMNSASEMSRGPMDAQIKHLWQQIKDKTENVQRLERDWIKKQTALVKDQQHLDKLGDEISSFKTKKSVLEHKKMRLNNIYTAHEKDIRQIKIALKNLQTEMNRLNDGLSKNWHSELKLKNENFHVQSEFVQKLKELESGNVKLEVDIDNLKEEKADLLANIVEAERQLLLWERKIQLEREIQDALDPEIGQSEIKELKKDIHRMELRLNEIRKRQEQTIFEMERAVHKRDTIQLKYTKNDDITDKKGANKENKTQIERQIQNYRGTLAQTAKNVKDYDKKIAQKQAELDETYNMINQAENTVVQNQEVLTQRGFDINKMKIAKAMNIYEIVKLQTLYRGFDNVLNKKFKAEASAQALQQRYDNAKEINTGMIEVLRNVAEEIPQFADMIQQMIDV